MFRRIVAIPHVAGEEPASALKLVAHHHRRDGCVRRWPRLSRALPRALIAGGAGGLEQRRERRWRAQDDPGREVGQQVDLRGRQLRIQRAVVREVIPHVVEGTEYVLHLRGELLIPRLDALEVYP